MAQVTAQQAVSVGDALNRTATAGRQKSTAADSASPAFSAIVSQVIQRRAGDKPKTVEDLMAELDNDEREFADSPSRDRFETYRKTVKALCQMLINRGYRLQGWEDKRHRRYEVVKTIDARLAQLYSGLLRRNQDVVIALHLMGQIRGLIFDLQA